MCAEARGLRDHPRSSVEPLPRHGRRGRFHRARARTPQRGLLMGALGVVYGDIGTSPLYAYKEAVKAAGGGMATPLAVTGAVSLIFWALILIVSIKYAILILRADNRGEGEARDPAGAPSRGRAGGRGAPIRRRGDHARHLCPFGGGGAEGRCPKPRPLRRADHHRDPRRPVRRAVPGRRPDRPYLRAGHAAVVRRPGAAGAGIHPARAADSSGPQPAEGRGIPVPCRLGRQLRDARCRLPGRHGRRGDVCRSRAFRRPADTRGMVRPGPARPGAQLFRAGRPAARGAGRDREPVLPPRAGLGAYPPGGPCDAGNDHCLAGDHLRGVLPDAAGDPARLPADHADRPDRP
ncbi:hypothetical protein Lal_00041194 [Lupinus albus]|nr:hypothetical protein Lal_00041194 [Lupinus albus]